MERRQAYWAAGHYESGGQMGGGEHLAAAKNKQQPEARQKKRGGGRERAGASLRPGFSPREEHRSGRPRPERAEKGLDALADGRGAAGRRRRRQAARGTPSGGG